jgi:serine/threonine protein kinase
MKRLKHDHVLEIFGANLNSNQLLLVCALKSQGDVCMFLHKTPSVNRRKLVRTILSSFVLQLCLSPLIPQCYDVSLGLVYLHENSVIHGDIKPVNMFLQSYSSTENKKLAEHPH